MIGLLWRNSRVIDEHSPGVEKNSSGYNLKEAFADGTLDLAKIVTGSEGTLAIVTEATLRLVELPKYRCSLVLFFDDLHKAGKAVLEARGYAPSALEIMDEGVLNAARGIDRTVDALVPEGSKTVLLVEFDGEDRSEIEERSRALEARVVRELGLSAKAVFAGDSNESENLWKIRKAAVPIIMKTRERRRPIAFVEDVVVPPESLPDFLERLHAVLRGHSVDAPAYGHAGEGNIHVRPVLDLSCEEDIHKMEAVAREVYSLTKEVGGSPSGEHGDGLVRAQFLKDFSAPLYKLFFWTKRIFDPKGILNPGKKIWDGTSISRNLRFGVSYANVSTGTGFDDARLMEQIERCHGCGMCRSVVNTTMCPVYRAVGDDKYSPRGKANLLRAMISGSLSPDKLIADPSFRELLGMCFGCRMCLSECPTEVNIPLLVTTAKAEIARKYGIPFSDRLFCNFEIVAGLGSLTAPLSNLLMRLGSVRTAIQRLSGLSRARTMPAFNRERFKPRRRSLL
ncbi:MAG: FAD-binding and (Fe-S)-binding domain-containing protein, partial [bacterium]